MIVFTFKTKPLFDKASEALKRAIDTMGSSHFDHSVQPSERTITVIKNKDAEIIEGFLKKEGITEFDKREDHSWAPVSAILRKCAEQCKAFLPSHGYESLAFFRGSTTGSSDLSITVRDLNGNLIDPFRLEYAIFDFTTGIEVLIGNPVNTPVRMTAGQYYAQVNIPADGKIGLWGIRWTIQEQASQPVYQSVQEFQVGDGTIPSFPDRNYRFTEFDKREDYSWAPVSAILRKCAEQCKAFLPSHGYESLMKVRRPEHTPGGSGKGKTDLGKPGDPEPIKPGEIVEIYENGKWIKVKWPGVN